MFGLKELKIFRGTKTDTKVRPFLNNTVLILHLKSHDTSFLWAESYRKEMWATSISKK